MHQEAMKILNAETSVGSELGRMVLLRLWRWCRFSPSVQSETRVAEVNFYALRVGRCRSAHFCSSCVLQTRLRAPVCVSGVCVCSCMQGFPVCSVLSYLPATY